MQNRLTFSVDDTEERSDLWPPRLTEKVIMGRTSRSSSQ